VPKIIIEGAAGFVTEVSIFFKEGAQDEALVRREDTGSQRLLHLDLYPTGWVPPQDLFVFDQPYEFLPSFLEKER
jgi:hypothetical protein